MSNTTVNNKRIAQNTLFLYCRQLITMGVSLYTVRIILDILGAEDYGIYNVIGGIVTLFSFLSNTMASSTQRFLSFEMGKEEKDASLSNVFSISMNIYIVLVVIIFLFSETIGLWFINNKLTIPETRLTAANYVYQSSILSFIVTLLCIPYNASIIAMERMNVFAYSSIVDAILKLAIVWLLPYIEIDHLKVYAILMFIAITSIQFFYFWYCKSHFNFCRYKHYKNKYLFNNMLSFAGWNMIGSLANILRGQGLNILINLFFSPVVNAAYSIAFQVNNAITNFTNNFYTAVRPQLVKLYASRRKEDMIELGFQSSRFAFYLMLIIASPMIMHSKEILEIWLKNVPSHTVNFLQIVIFCSLIEVLTIPLANMIQATGRIKTFQMTVSTLYLLNIPISYTFLFFGFKPEITLWINLTLILFSLLPRLLICKKEFGLSIVSYITHVLAHVSIPFAIIFICFYFYVLKYPLISNLFINISIEILFSLIIVIFMGLTSKERNYLITSITNKLK